MDRLGLLLSLPLESIAIRAILATLGAVVLLRLVLRAGLRSPRARVATALAPGVAVVALLATVLLTGVSAQLPEMMLPSEGATSLPIPVRNGYLNFAPMAAPLLVSLWASVAAWRTARRLIAVLRARSDALDAVAGGRADITITASARRVAQQLGVNAPLVALVPSCPGGAFVVGGRRPVVVFDRELAASLDTEELEGVLAHELAHVRRRDNLVATAIGIVRDLTFFVPGGGWAIRQLHRERELAADQIAVRATDRPGALASGLLKVLETAPDHGRACAPLAPSGGLVDRVKVLCDDAPPPGRVRRGLELGAVVSVVGVAAVASLAVPTALTGEQGQRDAVALVWSAASPSATTASETSGEARVFDVYRRAALDVSVSPPSSAGALTERSQDNRRAALDACATDPELCPVPGRSVGLGMQPPTIRVDHEVTRRWDPVPIGDPETADGLRLFWLAQRHS